MFKDEIYLKLSDFVYAEKEFSNYDNYEQLVINGLTNEEGYYINENFACAAYKKGNKIIISFRGTDDPKDIYDADLNILINNLPEDDFLKAEYFYKQLVNSSKYGECEIEFTGHSLGGAIAQLMGAKYGNKTVTFNAPGMYDQLEDIGCSTSIKYNYITNYTVLNDYIGNYKAHVGYTYYMQPLPIEKETLFDTHMGIFNYDENIHGAFISKPSGFTTLDALALWYFDVNNTLSPNISIASMNETQLVHAISIVEQCFGDADIQINPIKCTVNGKYFIVGSKGDDLLEGASKNDKLWGNDGDDTLYGYDGNDTIYSVEGNDVLIGGKGNDDLRGSQGFDTYIFYTGDGNDVIKETNQTITSVKGIKYKNVA